MGRDGIAGCCLRWSKDISQQSDRLIVDQVAHRKLPGSGVDGYTESVDDLRVHQIYLIELGDLGRAELEHTLHTSIPWIYSASRNNSTAWKGRDTLSCSHIPSYTRICILSTRPSSLDCCSCLGGSCLGGSISSRPNIARICSA